MCLNTNSTDARKTSASARSSASAPGDPRCNLLLGALPAVEFDRLLPHLEAVWLPAGKVIFEAGDRPHHAYFPITAIASLLYVMEDGGSLEVAIVGREGLLGIGLFTGGEAMPSQTVVLSEGSAYRLPRSVLKRELERFGGRRSGMLNQLLLRYTQALATQMAQTAVCNRHHTVAQQLCRWLLLAVDRLPSCELKMTQECIAGMLGVRREGVTEAAGKLQAAGLIKYSRGHITVLDRAALEARVCECYRIVRDEYERLLPPAT